MATSLFKHRVVFLSIPVVSLSFVHTHLSKEATQKGVSTMSTEENKVLSRRIFDEAASQGKFAVIDEAIAPTFVYRTSALPESHGILH